MSVKFLSQISYGSRAAIFVLLTQYQSYFCKYLEKLDRSIVRKYMMFHLAPFFLSLDKALERSNQGHPFIPVYWGCILEIVFPSTVHNLERREILDGLEIGENKMMNCVGTLSAKCPWISYLVNTRVATFSTMLDKAEYFDQVWYIRLLYCSLQKSSGRSMRSCEQPDPC